MILEIADAMPEDALDIATVHVAGLQAVYQGYVPEHLAYLVLEPQDVSKRVRGWQGWLRLKQVKTLVARMDGDVVGFCAMRPTTSGPMPGKVGEIASLYVSAVHWRQGIGRDLVQRMLQEAKELGLEGMFLWVFDGNEQAIRFYEACGFVPAGRKRLFLESTATKLYEIQYKMLFTSKAY